MKKPHQIVLAELHTSISHLKRWNLPWAQKHWSRAYRWTRQYLSLGFCEYELWGLHVHLAELIAPRLRRFASWFEGQSRPLNCKDPEQWVAYINKMARAFELIAKDSGLSEVERKEVKEGLDLFREYYFDLWD